MCVIMRVAGTLGCEVGFEADDDYGGDEDNSARKGWVCENRVGKTRIGKGFESGGQKVAEAGREDDARAGELQVAEDGFTSLVVR